ncbi:MAG: tetratricopeptide repeat protein [Pseudomonadota bacterium]|nr:tetratricopeptide repeat protein [Pseudomonadota bacterium]
MGWLLMMGLALATGAGLWRWVRRDTAALQFLGAALLLALAGYAWQGRPGFEGRPKPPPARGEVADSEFAQTRTDMLGQFDTAARWLTIAEGYQRRGDTQSGAQVIRSALREHPNDADLWVGLGNALVIHNDGMMSPAAELAFRRASRIAPDHPGPRYFYGLALAQGGNFDEAERIWRQLIAQAPPGAEYRPMIEERLQMLQQQRAMQTPVPAQGAPQGAPSPPSPQP